MLERVDVGRQSIDRYGRARPGRDRPAPRAGAPLRGCRVLHVNATPFGGGVAEILRSEIPLLRDLGIAADWQLISGDEAFFRVTKAIHNGLQGSARSRLGRRGAVSGESERAASLDDDYDIVVSRPPAAGAARAPRRTTVAGSGAVTSTRRSRTTRCGSSSALRRPYDAAVFTLGGFVPPDFPVARTEIIPPAIDPESPKNIDLGRAPRGPGVEWIGVETTRPAHHADLPVRRVEGSARRGRRVPTGARAGARPPARAGRLDGARRPRGMDVYREIQREVDADPRHPRLHEPHRRRQHRGERLPATRRRRHPEVDPRGLRAGGVRGALEGHAGGRRSRRRDPAAARGRRRRLPRRLRRECADASDELLADPELRRSFGERGRARVASGFCFRGSSPTSCGSTHRCWASTDPLPAPRPVGAREQRDPVCGMRFEPDHARHPSSTDGTTTSAPRAASSSSPPIRNDSCALRRCSRRSGGRDV